MSRVPRLLSAQKLASIQLTPAEAFLASRVDALLTEIDLALITGLPPQQVADALDRLAMLGAVDFIEPAAAPIEFGAPPARGPAWGPQELDEAVDLDIDKKRRILESFYKLDEVTYYELLGVDDQADKKQVKAAYYGLAPEFHPDKYFRKNLGSYKAKIEALFARITLAHDVLANPQRRKEYDEYLRTTQQNRAVSAALDQPAPDMAAIEAAVRQAADAAMAAAAQGAPNNGVASVPPTSTARATPSTNPTPARERASTPPVSADEALRLRREALARKLTGGVRRPAPTPAVRPTMSSRPPEMDPEIAARAADALRVRHEAAIADAKRGQVQRYLDAGKAAIDREDFAAGANAYRIALSLEPDDPAVQAECNQAMQVAATALADGYWKQASYEESQERWAEAALSYSKVCSGRPSDAAAHERVAFTTLKSSNNARRAVEFARKAVELAPKMPEFRITLARAYAAAGLAKSCTGELDRATELAHGNARVLALIAQARATAPKDAKVS